MLRDAFPHFNSVAAVLTFKHKRELLPSVCNQDSISLGLLTSSQIKCSILSPLTISPPNNPPTKKLCYNTLKLSFTHLFIFTDFRERRGGKRRETDRQTGRQTDVYLLSHLFTHSLVAPRMCPDQRSNPQLWRIGTML